MKKLKRISAVLMALILIVNAFSVAGSAAEKKELRFDDNGRFRILHITDTHFTDFPFEESIDFIGCVLDDYKPDLVILGGDNIKGWFDTSMQLGVRAAIDKLVAPFEERGIPFSFVYGNHDHQTYLCPKQLQSRYYGSHGNCIRPDGYKSLLRDGVGNIVIGSSANGSPMFNIWLFDSGTIIEITEDYMENVNAAQLKWYNKTCARLTEANGGKPVASLVFQHFPVEEVTKIFDADDNGVSVGGSKYKLKPGFSDSVYNGEFGAESTGMATHLNKTVDLSNENSGEYAAWVKNGDVIGAFFGHAHVNDYCGITDDNIILGSTLSAGGFNISSRFTDENGEKVEARGARIIDIDESILLDPDRSNSDALSTFSVYYSDYFDGSVEKYPSKYKAYDEHTFAEWLKIEFEYFKYYILSIGR